MPKISLKNNWHIFLISFSDENKMIITEQHIDLNIYHHHQLQPYEVVQTWKEDFDISFKVLHKGLYVFTLIIENEGRGFKLSDLDKELNIEIDWNLYSKIEASIYSVFLRDNPS